MTIALVASVGAAVVALVHLLTSGSFQVAADGDGIAKSFLWWRRRVSWREVADYSIGDRAGQRNPERRSSSHIVVGDSRALLSVSRLSCSTAYGAASLDMCWAPGRSHIPQEKMAKTWKARPWSA